ncbi:MAG: HAD family hydrolase [Chloroflexi bacterium]|nr:HAD family hydrolase [Chloroflexota bacterium]
MPKYSAIFFDLDGTLRASQPEGFEAFIEYAGRVGIALTAAQIAACEREAHRYWASTLVDTDMARFDKREFWVNYNHTLLTRIGVHDCPNCAHRIQDMFEHYDPEDIIFGDARHVLKTLHRAGYVLGLVSNRDTDLQPIAEKYGFDEFFHFTLYAGLVKSFKPDPVIFKKALELAGSLDAQRVLYVGDNYFADVVGARGVGMDALLIDPRNVFEEMYDQRVRRLRDVLLHIEH